VSQPTDAPASSAPAASLSPPAAPAAPAAPAGRDRRKFDRSIIEGPLSAAVWKNAWPAMLMSIIGGIQGMIDHALVGHLVGPQANAAIGVAWQIFLVVVVFIASIFIGMSVLVARFAGAGDEDMVDRTVYQAFITAMALTVGVAAPIGYFASPWLLDFVTTEAVKAEALPFLRVNFVFGGGMMLFFMLSGALRSVGEARRAMWLGVVMTVLNIGLNIVLITGVGPFPRLGTLGSAIGSAIAGWAIAIYALWRLIHGGWGVQFPRHHGFAPDWKIIRELFRIGLPGGVQGIAMNIGGVFMLTFIKSVPQSTAAQAAFVVCYGQIFSLITWTAQGMLGAAATVAGQNLGAKQPDRTDAAVHVAARYAFMGAAILGLFFLIIPRQLIGVFGITDPEVVSITLMRVLSVSGLMIAVALTYTGGLQGTGDTKSPLYISIVSQVIVPLGICSIVQMVTTLEPLHIWLAIFAGHTMRCLLSVWRFRQGKWRAIRLGVEPNAA
jgi:putative MATE family efflux protein